MREGYVDPEALDDVVLRDVAPGLAGLYGHRGGDGVIRIGERRAAIDASRELVENDQLRQPTCRRVPDRVAKKTVRSFTMHLLAPLALRAKSVLVFGASGEWPHPPPQHPLLPVLAGRIRRRPQGTEPEIEHGLGGPFRNRGLFVWIHGLHRPRPQERRFVLRRKAGAPPGRREPHSRTGTGCGLLKRCASVNVRNGYSWISRIVPKPETVSQTRRKISEGSSKVSENLLIDQPYIHIFLPRPGTRGEAAYGRRPGRILVRAVLSAFAASCGAPGRSLYAGTKRGRPRNPVICGRMRPPRRAAQPARNRSQRGFAPAPERAGAGLLP